MKNSLLVLCSLLMVSVPAFAAPEQKAALPTAALPPEAVAMMAPGARSLFLQRFPMGGTPVLVHLWTIQRSGPVDPKGSKPVAAPVFVDLFAPGASANSWLLANSASYYNLSGLGSPEGRPLKNVTVRWLSPAKKRGMVVVVTTGDNSDSIMDLITFPNGADISFTASSDWTQFHTGDEGLSTSSQKFGIDKEGFMTIIETNATNGGHLHDMGEAPVMTTVYRWNGQQFAAPK